MLSRSSSEELVLDLYSLPSSPEIGERTPASTDEEMEEPSTSLFFDNGTPACASVFDDQMSKLINCKTVSCSLKGADFAAGNIIDADFTRLDLTKSALLPANALNSIINFSIALDVVNAKFLDPIRHGNDQREYLISEITARKNIIAKALIYRLENSCLNRKQKIDYLNIALDHAVFVPESLLQRIANSTDRGIFSLGNTLFGDQQRYHACYATPAMTMLERAREKLLQNENKLRV